MEEHEDNGLMLSLSRKIKRSHKMIKAHCKYINKKFVVLAGSQIEETDSVSVPDSIKKIRQCCFQQHQFKDGVLSKDYLFNSASYAAEFVLGESADGKTAWKTEDGATLKALEEKEI